MMRFTSYQYEEAIKRLQEAQRQLEPDGNCCSICGDGGHMAFECGHNPLVAIAICRQISEQSEQLHNTLHWLAGWDFAFGVMLGPRKCQLPYESLEDEAKAIRAKQPELTLAEGVRK